MKHIYLHELMTRNVKCVSTSATIKDVAEKMRENAYSCIVIVEQGSPIGIITERDMVRILAEVLRNPTSHSHLVSDFMTRRPMCLSEHATLYEALVVTQTRSIRHIPIVDDNDQLAGLVTQTDIAKAHFLAVEKQRDLIEQTIRDRTKDLVQANEELKALALQDGLLGIGNRRAMEVDIHFTHANSVRYGHPYALALVDVDYFKKYNDHYGHQGGDDALARVSKVLKQSIRASDRLYRYGGEEFLILMPETTLFEAVEAVHRVTENLELADLPHKQSSFGRITVSAGVSELNETNRDSWTEVVATADKYLYQAKDLGRNQVAWDVSGVPHEVSAPTAQPIR